MPKLKIKDIAVLGTIDRVRGYPIGEAPGRDDTFSLLSVHEREQMLDRLLDEISDFMEKANSIHREQEKILQADDETDSDFITRLGTHEFFFYTQEPLSLLEFEILQNKIAQKAEHYSSGIQLILGSFAVKLADNRVINITPHITCGDPPSFHFIIKNFTSEMDVRYREVNPDREVGDVLDMFDKNVKLPLPEIRINGQPHLLTFYNLVTCKAPSGQEFLTAVDVCLDHLEGVAKSNLVSLINEKPETRNQLISHVIVSNYAKLNRLHCLGLVMHIDPLYSPTVCKKGVLQHVREERQNPHFGKGGTKIYDLSGTYCESVQDAMDFLVIQQQIEDELNFINSFESQLILSDKKKAQTLLFNMEQQFTLVTNLEEGRLFLSEIKMRSLELFSENQDKQLNILVALKGNDTDTELDVIIKKFKAPVDSFQERLIVYEEIKKVINALLVDTMNLQMQKLEEFKFGKDELLSQFISDKWIAFRNAKTQSERLEIINEVKSIIEAFNADEASDFIRHNITDLRNSSWSYVSYGTLDKAHKLEMAMSTIPVNERVSFLSSAAYPEVMKILASKPGWMGTNDPPLTVGGKIDKSAAAEQFLEFKQKFKKQKNEEQEKEQKHEDSESSRIGNNSNI